jgi:peptidoglycan hydrolase CwlO-like protein
MRVWQPIQRKVLRAKAQLDQFDAKLSQVRADLDRLQAEMDKTEAELTMFRAEIETTLDREMRYLAECGLL